VRCGKSEAQIWRKVKVVVVVVVVFDLLPLAVGSIARQNGWNINTVEFFVSQHLTVLQYNTNSTAMHT
jgi:hypothetical protein